MTTDGAAAMQGSQKSVVKRIKQLSPECVGIYCILNREALVTKKLRLNAVAVGDQENELNDVLWQWFSTFFVPWPIFQPKIT